MIAIGIGVVALALVAAVVLSRKPAPVVKKDMSQLTQSEDDQEAIPTAGPGVTVELKIVVPQKEFKLLVSGVPDKTTSIEYEVKYSTKDQESEGVFSTARPKEGGPHFPTTFERQITLGTCSKNVCRYHQVTSDISVTLKFEGSYGAQLLQKKFDYAKL